MAATECWARGGRSLGATRTGEGGGSSSGFPQRVIVSRALLWGHSQLPRCGTMSSRKLRAKPGAKRLPRLAMNVASCCSVSHAGHQLSRSLSSSHSTSRCAFGCPEKERSVRRGFCPRSRLCCWSCSLRATYRGPRTVGGCIVSRAGSRRRACRSVAVGDGPVGLRPDPGHGGDKLS